MKNEDDFVKQLKNFSLLHWLIVAAVGVLLVGIFFKLLKAAIFVLLAFFVVLLVSQIWSEKNKDPLDPKG